MEWGAKCSDLETQLELASVQKEEVGKFFLKIKINICFSFVHKYESFQVEEMVKRLQQEARDGVEEKKIGERKSVAMVRFKRSWTNDPWILEL